MKPIYLIDVKKTSAIVSPIETMESYPITTVHVLFAQSGMETGVNNCSRLVKLPFQDMEEYTVTFKHPINLEDLAVGFESLAKELRSGITQAT